MLQPNSFALTSLLNSSKALHNRIDSALNIQTTMSSPFNLILISEFSAMDFLRLLKQWAAGPFSVRPSRSRSHSPNQNAQTRNSYIVLLDEILVFNRFKGIMYNPYNINHPDLLFTVSLRNGTEEVIRCGKWVHGKPACVNSLMKLKLKISQAKELVPWDWMWDTRQMRREEVLQLEWPSAANHHE
ncbi:hypothetical protein N7454_003448 [Penicillium verhagenii]|nr:hypothetical protein N7454_003448 [Penicillium verhagenii]